MTSMNTGTAANPRRQYQQQQNISPSGCKMLKENIVSDNTISTQKLNTDDHTIINVSGKVGPTLRFQHSIDDDESDKKKNKGNTEEDLKAQNDNSSRRKKRIINDWADDDEDSVDDIYNECDESDNADRPVKPGIAVGYSNISSQLQHRHLSQKQPYDKTQQFEARSSCKADTTDNKLEKNSSKSLVSGSSRVLRPSLDKLPIDAAAIIFSHLTVQEIAAVALVCSRLEYICRSNQLWKRKFQARWNIKCTQNWYKAYKQAYQNPHDLWITHWNCVFPNDGLAPGRCCIVHTPKTHLSRRSQKLSNYCPSCRYFPLDFPSSTYFTNCERATTTEAQRIAQATQRTIQKVCRHYKHLPKHTYSSRKANRAFARASTFHRSIDTQQYVATSNPPITSINSLHFLTDLLFFNAEQQHQSDKQDMVELQHLKRDAGVKNSSCSGTSSASSILEASSSSVTAMDDHQTSHHTWHIAEFTNPDYDRSIIFRVCIKRVDCFTVFPSEGLLEPGETLQLVFGVRPLGSLIATACEQINVRREGIDPDLLEVYEEHAQLPWTPFCIRYKYAHTVPCIPEGFKTPILPTRLDLENEIRENLDNQRWDDDAVARTLRGRRHTPNGRNARATEQSQQQSSDNLGQVCQKRKQTLDFLWGGGGKVESHQVRNIYLSAHVQSRYSFWEFLRETLTPWNILHRDRIMVYTAPQLKEFHPNVYDRLQRVEKETQLTHAAHDYRTEKQRCRHCSKRSWGGRLEELGQAYAIAVFECLVYQKERNNHLQNMVRCLRTLDLLEDIDQKSSERALDQKKNRIQPLLYKIHDIVQRYRAAPWINDRQLTILTQLEDVVDQLYSSFSLKEKKGDNHIETDISWRPLGLHSLPNSLFVEDKNETEIPWRYSGLYRLASCTESAFVQPTALEDNKNKNKNKEHSSKYHADGSGDSLGKNLWKEEPNYLDSFRHLAYYPGFCLGQQEDVNHLDERKPPSLAQQRYYRRQKGAATDMFMDDPICSLKSALCMLYNPRSALVHGIYDEVPYPGSVIRRPKIPVLFVKDDAASKNNSKEIRKPLPTSRRTYFQLQDALDLESVLPPLPTSNSNRHNREGSMSYPMSLKRYLCSIPSPGVGRFPLSKELDGVTATNKSITEIILEDEDENNNDIHPYQKNLPIGATGETNSSHTNNRQIIMTNNVDLPLDPMNDMPPILGLNRGPRFLNFLWTVSAQLGWTVEGGQWSVFVDRKLLISIHWISVSLMALPLSYTLFARYIRWIPSKPVDYYLENLPYELHNEMRYLSEYECGYVALVIVLGWMILGRWLERNISRDFFRSMLEHLPTIKQRNQHGKPFFRRCLYIFSLWWQRQWDYICPLFIQRFIFVPQWNCRTHKDLLKHIACWRSKDYREHRSFFKASNGRGFMPLDQRGDERVNIGNESSLRKYLISFLVALASFCSSSPHFWLNLLTIFSCSIGLGLSMALHSIETSMSGVAFGGTGSLLNSLRLATSIILSLLIGQLLGSSGGVLFLAEFVVTSVSLVLGGAGTISASSVESWACFFFLAHTAFWGYLFGRAALDGVRKKNIGGFSSTILCCCLIILSVLWIIMFSLWTWEVPMDLMVVHPELPSSLTQQKEMRRNNIKKMIFVSSQDKKMYASKYLQ